MKFFNIDMHISIIHDIKTIFSQLGHSVDSICMSEHTWVTGEQQGSTKIINPYNWHKIDQDLCNNFYNTYKNQLQQYDGFVHSYPPAFSLLFEQWNKPIITIACTRFEYPCSNRLPWLIEGLNRLKSKGLLIPVANNLFDKAYCERYTKFTWKHIPSLCNYMKVKWSFGEKLIKLWNKSKVVLSHNLIDKNFTINKKYDRNQVILSSLAIIHIPYNVSIMSAFEHYYCNVPIFVPTRDLIEKWIQEKKHVLSEIHFPNSPLEINPEWILLSDWYDDNNMPYTIKFNSADELYQLIESTDYIDISEKMKAYNIIREKNIISSWQEVLNNL